MSHLSFHLSELLWRLFYILIASFISFFLFGNYFKEVIYYLICLKADISYIIITNPLDGVFSFLSLTSFLSIFGIFIPQLILHLYLYIRPSLIFRNTKSKGEEWIWIIFLTLIPIFSFYIALIILPYAIKILLSPIFGNKDFNIFFIYWVPQIKGIISLLITLSISTFIYILIPIILIYYQIKIGNPRGKSLYISIVKWRPLTILITFLGLAIVTPPDLITLLITAIPFILLLEISFLLTLIVLKYSIKDIY